MAPVKKHSLRPEPGRHLLVDFFGVAPRRLRDGKGMMEVLDRALRASRFDIIRRSSHKFRGGGKGVTGIFILAQSHAAFHSYPESGYLALDVYTCGRHDPEPIARRLERFLRPRRVARLLHTRG